LRESFQFEIGREQGNGFVCKGAGLRLEAVSLNPSSEEFTMIHTGPNQLLGFELKAREYIDSRDESERTPQRARNRSSAT